MASSLVEGLSFTTDGDEDNPDKLTPVLDVKVGMDRTQNKLKVKHFFYQKPCANPLVLQAKGALAWNIKRATMIAEGMRRLHNTSPTQPDTTKAEVLNRFLIAMKSSGYTEDTRIEVALSIIRNHRRRLESTNGKNFYQSGWKKQTHQEKL